MNVAIPRRLQCLYDHGAICFDLMVRGIRTPNSTHCTFWSVTAHHFIQPNIKSNIPSAPLCPKENKSCSQDTRLFAMVREQGTSAIPSAVPMSTDFEESHTTAANLLPFRVTLTALLSSDVLSKTLDPASSDPIHHRRNISDASLPESPAIAAPYTPRGIATYGPRSLNVMVSLQFPSMSATHIYNGRRRRVSTGKS